MTHKTIKTDNPNLRFKEIVSGLPFGMHTVRFTPGGYVQEVDGAKAPHDFFRPMTDLLIKLDVYTPYPAITFTFLGTGLTLI